MLSPEREKNSHRSPRLTPEWLVYQVKMIFESGVRISEIGSFSRIHHIIQTKNEENPTLIVHFSYLFLMDPSCRIELHSNLASARNPGLRSILRDIQHIRTDGSERMIAQVSWSITYLRALFFRASSALSLSQISAPFSSRKKVSLSIGSGTIAAITCPDDAFGGS